MSDFRFDFPSDLFIRDHEFIRMSSFHRIKKKKGVSSHQKTRLIIETTIPDQCFQCVPSQPWKECNRSKPVTLSRFQQPSLTNSFFYGIVTPTTIETERYPRRTQV
ncbi:hypothetical protein TNCT_639231 [Trichonephila clavata]|uniref:Uncharacterized protein n=1 Tax=Trichonephila clavata TaxID=2740835 RepID=A0A8X6HPJ8_TRICU|nr:hypothetical protein TNCT_639231 [Trichonephila clavata]